MRLLFVLAALGSHLAAADSVLSASSNKNIAFAGNRKLLHGSGSSGEQLQLIPKAAAMATASHLKQTLALSWTAFLF